MVWPPWSLESWKEQKNVMVTAGQLPGFLHPATTPWGWGGLEHVTLICLLIWHHCSLLLKEWGEQNQD